MRKKDPKPRPHPAEAMPAGGLAEWMRTECVIDHCGSEESYRLKLASDGHSFSVEFPNGQTRTINVDGRVEIEFVFPSVEGTVVMCQMMRGRRRFFSVTDGHELAEEELRRINPHFYT